MFPFVKPSNDVSKITTLSRMICYCLREIIMASYDSEKWLSSMTKGDPER